MGINPAMYMIFGIDNLEATEKWQITDSRYTNGDNSPLEMIDTELTVDDNSPDNILIGVNYQGKKCISDFLHWDAEYGLSNVIGLNCGSMNDGNVLRALALLDEKYMTAGYEVLPIESFNAPAIMSRRKFIERNAIRPEHFYKLGYIDNVPRWIDATLWLFDKFGLTVKPGELKLMLYWEWS